MIRNVERLHISENDLAKDLRSILQRVETGAEVIIERDAQPLAVIRPAEPLRRKISECIALLPGDSTATVDPDFARAAGASLLGLMLDSTVAVAGERQGKNSRQVLEYVALETGDDENCCFRCDSVRAHPWRCSR